MGEIQLNNGKLISKGYEIINVIGKGERRVGFWTPTTGITKEIDPSNNEMYSSHPTPNNYETITWPGGSATVAKH